MLGISTHETRRATEAYVGQDAPEEQNQEEMVPSEAGRLKTPEELAFQSEFKSRKRLMSQVNRQARGILSYL